MLCWIGVCQTIGLLFSLHYFALCDLSGSPASPGSCDLPLCSLLDSSYFGHLAGIKTVDVHSDT